MSPSKIQQDKDVASQENKGEMFIGEYLHSLDEKGRLAIPARFRSSLQHGGVITKGLDGCLVLYTKEEWRRLATRLSALPMNKSNTRAFARLMLAGAMDVLLDRQGRVVVPEYLRQYAGLIRRVVVAGLYTRFEIWDEKRWEEYKNVTERESDTIAEQLGELGI